MHTHVRLSPWWSSAGLDKGHRWADGHQVMLTGAQLWAPCGLTAPSSLWALCSFPRWWFRVSLQPQTSFPSPSQPPDVVTDSLLCRPQLPPTALYQECGLIVSSSSPLPSPAGRESRRRWPISIGMPLGLSQALAPQ